MPTSQHGIIDLALERRGGATRPARLLARPPLQVSRARYDDPARPGALSLTVVHLGGVLAGDRYCLDIACGAGAEATITTAAATQVYRMPEGEAAQDVAIRLGSGARLAWLPEPTILFGGSRYRQTTRVAIAPGARLALLDVIVPGRLARGEVFAFERCELRLEVEDATGRLLAAERATLEPANQRLASPGAFGASPVLGSLYLLGDLPAADIARAITSRGEGGLGAAVLPNSAGVLVRAAGASPHDVRRRLVQLLGEVG